MSSKGAAAGPPRLAIHIGLKKSGSATLQTFFSDNVDALRPLGIDYPEVARRSAKAHHNLPRELRGRKNFLREYGGAADFVEYMKGSGHPLTIISSEMFESLTAEQVGRFHESVGGVRQAFTIVIMIRDLLDLIASSYAQKVRYGQKNHDFDAFFSKRMAESRVSYFTTAEKWANAFGWENIRVRVLDRRFLRNNDLIDDFLATTGVDPDNPAVRALARPGIVNSASGWRILEAVRALYCRKSPLPPGHRMTGILMHATTLDRRKKIEEAAIEAGQKRGWLEDRGAYLTREQAQMVLDLYAESVVELNTRLATPLPTPDDLAARGFVERTFMPHVGQIPRPELMAFYEDVADRLNRNPRLAHAPRADKSEKGRLLRLVAGVPQDPDGEPDDGGGRAKKRRGVERRRDADGQEIEAVTLPPSMTETAAQKQAAEARAARARAEADEARAEAEEIRAEAEAAPADADEARAETGGARPPAGAAPPSGANPVSLVFSGSPVVRHLARRVSSLITHEGRLAALRHSMTEIEPLLANADDTLRIDLRQKVFRQFASLGVSYQYNDFECVDYALYELTPDLPLFRGPPVEPEALERGDYFCVIGAAQTFGRLIADPWPALLSQEIGLPVLNLSRAGAGPDLFLDPTLLHLIQKARFAVIQVMSGRSVGDAEFPGGRRVAGNAEFEGANRWDVLEHLWRKDPNDAFAAVRRWNETYVGVYRQLSELISRPTMMLWFSSRRPEDWKPKDLLTSLDWGDFPQLIGVQTYEQIAALTDERIEYVTGLSNVQATSRITGLPCPYFGQGKALHAEMTYYPSSEDHVELARELSLWARGAARKTQG